MRVNVLVTAALVAALPALSFAEEYETCIGVIKYENGQSDIPVRAVYVDILQLASDTEFTVTMDNSEVTKAQAGIAAALRDQLGCPEGDPLACWSHPNYGNEGCADTAETIAAVKREIATRLVLASK